MASCSGGMGGLITVSFTTTATQNSVADTGSKSEVGVGMVATITASLLFMLNILPIKKPDLSNLNLNADGLIFFNDLYNDDKIDNINENYSNVMDNGNDTSSLSKTQAKSSEMKTSINIMRPVIITNRTGVVDKQRFVTE
tara:strand:+ start:1616 stop:2035 length:420 start_codon:yes stop_codon:yes gene_type:complete